MSLVLKSNNTATASLGNINGLPSQDFALFLDFERGEYIQKKAGVRTILNESDVLVSTSNKNMLVKPVTINRATRQVEYTTTADQIRFYENTITKRFGLLVEADQINWFKNSETPATQVISAIPSNSVLVASVVGEGSLKLSGATINTVTVTEGSPVTVTPTQSGEFSINAESIGSLSHVQIIRVAGHAGDRSRMTSTATTRPSGYDNIELNTALLTSVIDTTKPVTILVQSTQVADTQEIRTSAGETRIVVETEESIAALGLNKASSHKFGPRISSYKKSDGNLIESLGVSEVTVDYNKEITQVFVLKDSGVLSAVNGGGLIAANNSVNLHQLTSLKIGSHMTSPATNQGASCIFTKLAIFNKALTNAEIIEYSKTWL